MDNKLALTPPPEFDEFELQRIEVVKGLAAEVPGTYGIPTRVFEAYKESFLGLNTSMTYMDFVYIVQNSPHLHACITAEREKVLDQAEAIVAEVLHGEKHTSDRVKMAQWVLKEQGRTRGYVDGKKAVRIKPAHPEVPPVQINFVAVGDVDVVKRPGRPTKQPALIVQQTEAITFPPVPPSKEQR
jgi:hypothetical protein